MPPPAKKAKQIKDEKQAAPMLLEYLRKQNRPYNANDIFANLHEAISKTIVARTLAKMATEKESIQEKVYGKQKIYFALQTDYDKLTSEELNALDDEIDALKKQLETDNQKASQLASELAASLATPTTEDAENELEEIKARNQKKSKKLEDLEANGDKMTAADKERINKAYSSALKSWRQRRRMGMEVINQILEGYPKSKKDLFEAVGIETDEDYGADINTFDKV